MLPNVHTGYPQHLHMCFTVFTITKNHQCVTCTIPVAKMDFHFGQQVYHTHRWPTLATTDSIRNDSPASPASHRTTMCLKRIWSLRCIPMVTSRSQRIPSAVEPVFYVSFSFVPVPFRPKTGTIIIARNRNTVMPVTITGFLITSPAPNWMPRHIRTHTPKKVSMYTRGQRKEIIFPSLFRAWCIEEKSKNKKYRRWLYGFVFGTFPTNTHAGAIAKARRAGMVD